MMKREIVRSFHRGTKSTQGRTLTVFTVKRPRRKKKKTTAAEDFDWSFITSQRQALA
ncbi:MAG: hypothetical protein IPJ65_25690 [Archangiaceae bacterium]|nr:hypothetical protein [Archangiaceae bacterium]